LLNAWKIVDEKNAQQWQQCCLLCQDFLFLRQCQEKKINVWASLKINHSWTVDNCQLTEKVSRPEGFETFILA